MALLTCISCGRQVSDKAPACPGCGQPAARPSFVAARSYVPVPPRPASYNRTTQVAVGLSGAVVVGILVTAFVVNSQRDAERRAEEVAQAASAAASDRRYAEERAAEAKKKPAGTTAAPARSAAGVWATIRPPTLEERTTPVGRARYWLTMTEAHPGEPPLDLTRARPLMEELRAKVAESAGAPKSAVAVTFGTASASIKIASGTTAGMRDDRDPHRVGVCAAGIFGPTIMANEKLLAAGVRSIMCISDLCGGAYNLRPDAKPAFLTNGEACPDIEDVLRAGMPE